MSIGSKDYTKKELPLRGWHALRDGLVFLIEELQMDLDALIRGGEFRETNAAYFLPSKYLPSYDQAFLRRFLVCVIVVGSKLFDRVHEHRLACTAEELALNAILTRARDVLEETEQNPVDFRYVENVAFEDADFETLFDPSLDGIEDSPSGKYLRMVNLKLKEWFLPFSEGDVVHPYADGAAWEKPSDPAGGR